MKTNLWKMTLIIGLILTGLLITGCAYNASGDSTVKDRDKNGRGGVTPPLQLNPAHPLIP